MLFRSHCPFPDLPPIVGFAKTVTFKSKDKVPLGDGGYMQKRLDYLDYVAAQPAPGIVVLEEYEHAKKRGARIYAEVVGYGLSGDAYHITSPSPDGDGGFRSMSAALKRAGMTPSDIDYINAHGTSTLVGDEIDRKSTRLNSSHRSLSRMPSSA